MLITSLFSFGLSMLSFLFLGKILSLCWSWFVVLVFPSAPQVTYLQSLGLYFTLWCFNLDLYMPINRDDKTATKDAAEKQDNKLLTETPDVRPRRDNAADIQYSINRSFVKLFIVYPLCLVFAWSLHQFVR